MNRDELLNGALIGLEDTQHGSGTATAPSTATDILTTTPNVKAGLFEFEITISLTGTAETLTRNLNLRLGSAGTVLIAALLTVPGTNTYKIRRRFTQSDINIANAGVVVQSVPINLRTVAAPTAGAVYTVAVRATLMGG